MNRATLRRIEADDTPEASPALVLARSASFTPAVLGPRGRVGHTCGSTVDLVPSRVIVGTMMRRLQKTIFEIGWTRTVPRLAETDPVATAFDLMSRESHDCVLIARGERLVGIFTSR